MHECDCGPWIKLSMCGMGAFSNKTGQLWSVQCPSRFCMTMVVLVDGKISDHDGVIAGRCPFIGVRVVDDTADFIPGDPTHVPPPQEQQQ